MHTLPENPVTVAFGQTSRVCWECTISVNGMRCSVPHPYVVAHNPDVLVLSYGGHDGINTRQTRHAESYADVHGLQPGGDGDYWQPPRSPVSKAGSASFLGPCRPRITCA